MNYLFIPKDVLEEKLSSLEYAVNEMKRIANKDDDSNSIARPFYELLFIQYKAFKALRNYTLAPPGVRVSEVKQT